MRIISYTAAGSPSYGFVVGDHVVDRTALGLQAPTVRDLIASGELPAEEAVAAAAPTASLADVTLLPPVVPGKILCAGVNFPTHREETGQAPEKPDYPVIFSRFADSHVAHEHDIRRPAETEKFDYEGELAVVIGTGGRHIPRERALSHIAGYTCFNESCYRDFQFKQSLTIGKNFHASGSFGPWMTTADEIPDPRELVLATRLNGVEVQHAPVSELIFDIPYLINYLSGVTELVPGDVIVTGTPEGVGFARTPPLWLKAGDEVEVEISRIGILRNGVEPE